MHNKEQMVCFALHFYHFECKHINSLTHRHVQISNALAKYSIALDHKKCSCFQLLSWRNGWHILSKQIVTPRASKAVQKYSNETKVTDMSVCRLF